jgi:hypothetical protein
MSWCNWDSTDAPPCIGTFYLAHRIVVRQHGKRGGQVAGQRIAGNAEMGVGRQLAAVFQALKPLHHIADLAEGPAVIMDGIVGTEAVADIVFDEFGAAEGDDVFVIIAFEQRTAEACAVLACWVTTVQWAWKSLISVSVSLLVLVLPLINACSYLA